MSRPSPFLPRVIIECVLSVASCVACSQRGGAGDISTFTVTRTDFENTLAVAGFVEPLNVTPVICPRGIDGIVEWLVEEGTVVEEGDVLCVIDYPALETDYDEAVIRFEEARTALTRTEADLAMQYALLEAQVRSNEAESEIARLDSLELLYSTPNQRRIRELQLESSLIEKTRYEKKLEALKAIQSSELRRLEIGIRQIGARVETAREMLDRLTVRAPKAGLVVLPDAWLTGEKLKLGDNVWTNHPIATLPGMGGMKVRMTVPEADYRLISLGDSVVYRFDAMPDNPGGGRITNRSLQGQPVKRGSQVKQFEIEASIDSVAVMPGPGLSADCRIVLRRAAGVVVVPQVALFARDSAQVVYVRRGRGWEERRVKTGHSSATEAVVDSGLAPGEVVALGQPPERRIVKTESTDIWQQEESYAAPDTLAQ